MNNHKWIFQGNPDIFPIDRYIKDNSLITWTVKQKHYAEKMDIGDTVFIWRASGANKGIAGVIAQGSITSQPTVAKGDEASQGMWEEAEKEELRVQISLKRKCLGAKEVVRRDWLKDDPILSGLSILRQAAGTNFFIDADEAKRLSLLVKNTGRPWNREEAIAGLWAYAHTYGQPISKLPSSPVALVAVAIGRAVTGVYNKVMNFRHLDPRDEKKGLSGGSGVDIEVWQQYYDQAKGDLNIVALDQAYLKYWGISEAASGIGYVEFGEAPNDDPEELQMFAARVRRGQPKFRQNLLEAYDYRCAITGHGPPEVLEAVHIVPHASSGINELDNGLLLRADLHTLYDCGLLRIKPHTFQIEVDSSLKDTPYYAFNGMMLRSRIKGAPMEAKYLEEKSSKCL